MLENAKNIILIALIILSVILSGKLWFGSDQYEMADEPTSERIDFGDKAEIFEQVAPDKIYYKFDANNDVFGWRSHTDQYKKIWNLLKEEFIQELISPGTELEIYEGKDVIYSDLTTDYNEINEQMNNYNELVLDFSFQIGIFLKNNFNTLLISDEKLEQIDRLVLYLDSDNLIKGVTFTGCDENEVSIEAGGFAYDSELLAFEFENEDYFTDDYSYELLRTDELFKQIDLSQIVDNSIADEMNLNEQLLKDIFSYKLETGCEIIIPSNQENRDVFSPKKVEYEELEKEKLAKAFFHNLSFVRKIDEWDGGFIFTDGQKGLRFLPNGGFEYDAPRKSPPQIDLEGIDIAEVIDKSGEYISLYGGWNENLFLDEIEIIEHGYSQDYINYKSTYKYLHNGYPVINKEQLTIDFDFQGVYNYVREVFGNIEKLDINNDEMKKTEEIIINWLREELIRKTDKVIEEKTDMLIEAADSYEDNEGNSNEENNEMKIENVEINININKIKKGYYLKIYEETVGIEDIEKMVPVLIIESKFDKFIYNTLDGELIDKM